MLSPNGFTQLPLKSVRLYASVALRLYVSTALRLLGFTALRLHGSTPLLYGCKALGFLLEAVNQLNTILQVTVLSCFECATQLAFSFSPFSLKPLILWSPKTATSKVITQTSVFTAINFVIQWLL